MHDISRMEDLKSMLSGSSAPASYMMYTMGGAHVCLYQVAVLYMSVRASTSRLNRLWENATHHKQSCSITSTIS